MKRTYLIIAAVVIAALTIGLTLSSQSQDKKIEETTTKSSETVAVDPNTVIIKDFAFGPETIKVKRGTTIKWVNQDKAHHDITPTSGADDFKASELLNEGESYSATFNTVGTYTYKCSPHPYMKGTIEVTE